MHRGFGLLRRAWFGVQVLFTSLFHVRQSTLKLAIILMSIPKFKQNLFREGKLFFFQDLYFVMEWFTSMGVTIFERHRDFIKLLLVMGTILYFSKVFHLYHGYSVFNFFSSVTSLVCSSNSISLIISNFIRVECIHRFSFLNQNLYHRHSYKTFLISNVSFSPFTG